MKQKKCEQTEICTNEKAHAHTCSLTNASYNNNNHLCNVASVCVVCLRANGAYNLLQCTL